MAIASGQTISAGSNTGTTTIALIFASPITAGSVVVVTACVVGTVVGISDNNGNKYRQPVPKQVVGSANVYTYFVENAVSGLTTVTITLSGSIVNDAIAREYTGVAAIKPFDYINVRSGNSSSPSIGPVDTSQWPNEIVISTVGYDSFVSSVGAGMSNFVSSELGSSARVAIEDNLISTTSSSTTSFVLSNTANWSIFQLAFANTQIVRTGKKINQRPHPFSPGLAR